MRRRPRTRPGRPAGRRFGRGKWSDPGTGGRAVGRCCRPGRLPGQGDLVHLPAHAGRFEALRHRRPAVAPGGTRVVDGGPTLPAFRIDGGAQREQAVGERRAQHGAVVRVADGERVGQGVVEGQVRAPVVAHRGRARRRPVLLRVHHRPPVHPPAVPACVLGVPGVGDVVHPGARRRRAVEVEGEQAVRRHVAGPARPPLGHTRPGPVGEAPDPSQGAEVVVERAVLLDEEHHVLDRAQTGRPGDRASPRRVGRPGRHLGTEGESDAGARAQLEQPAAGEAPRGRRVGVGVGGTAFSHGHEPEFATRGAVTCPRGRRPIAAPPSSLGRPCPRHVAALVRRGE